MPTASRWQTRANALTALRLCAAPALATAVCADAPGLGLVWFALAVATDFADGWVARRYRESSPLGGLVDHSVDATFVTVGTATYAMLGVLPLALPVIIVAAFLQYVIDSRAGATRHLRASALGRWNGIAYYVILAVPLVRDSFGLGFPSPGLLSTLAWVLVASSAVSMADRFLASRP
jgi:phosphatidylglycerophosphate synthase